MALVRQQKELLPHLLGLLAHEADGRDEAVGRRLGELEVKVLVLKVAELLDVGRVGAVEDLLDARPSFFVFFVGVL